MLSRVEVRTRQGSILNLTLDDPSNGFIVGEIEGLGPVKATLVSSGFAGTDGEQYHNAKREKRNIKFNVELQPDYITNTVRELRQELYDFMMPKAEVMLRFVDSDDTYVDIWGRVESNEPSIFTKEPSSDISIICFNPDFVDPNPVTVAGLTTALTNELEIIYGGTVETGFLLTMNVNRTLNDFSIYHTPPDGSLRIVDFSAPLVAGDILEISSVTGAKGAMLTHLGTDSSVLYGISPQSPWLQLEKGSNKIRVYATGAGVPYTISYTTKHGGL
jgi:hypothetical protein